MDFRRSASIERWHFGVGDDTAGIVRWYVAAPGAATFKGPTPYRSLDSVQVTDRNGRPGPDPDGYISYDKGARNDLYTGDGEPCGGQWFESGIPSPPPPNPVTNPDGVPICCTNHRFAAWSSDGLASSAWITVPPLPPGVRQEASVQGEWATPIVPFLNFPTLTGSGLVVAITVVDFYLSLGDVYPPSGWTLAQKVRNGWMNQYWFTSFNSPSVATFPEFESTYTGGFVWSASAYEVTGLVDGGSLDVSAVNAGTFDRATCAVKTINDTVDCVIGCMVSTDGIGPVGNDGWYVLPTSPPGWLWVIPEVKNQYKGQNVLLRGFNDPQNHWAIGYMALPQIPVKGVGWWYGNLHGSSMWQTDEHFRVSWTSSAAAGDSWVTAAIVASAWTSSAAAGDSWVTAAIVASAWTSSAAAGDSWVGHLTTPSAWTSSAAAGDSWVGFSPSPSAWSSSALGTNSWGSSRSGTWVDDQVDATSTGASAGITWTGTLVANQLQVVAACTGQIGGGIPTWTLPSGWTALGSQTVSVGAGGGNVRIRVTLAYKLASGGETSTGTFTASSASQGIVLRGWVLSNVTTTTANYQFNAPTGGFSTSPTTGSLTPSVFSVFLGCMCDVTQNFAGPFTPSGSGLGPVASGAASNPTNTVAGEVLQSASAVTFSDSFGANSAWVGVIGMFPKV